MRTSDRAARLFVATATFGYDDRDGQPATMREGTIVVAGNPLLRDRREMFARLQTDLLIARQGASFDLGGQPFLLNPGDIVRIPHPIVNGRESLFAPVTVTYELPG
jgi:hypothetical protein